MARKKTKRRSKKKHGKAAVNHAFKVLRAACK